MNSATLISLGFVRYTNGFALGLGLASRSQSIATIVAPAHRGAAKTGVWLSPRAAAALETGMVNEINRPVVAVGLPALLASAGLALGTTVAGDSVIYAKGEVTL